MYSGAEIELGIVADAAVAAERLCDALEARTLRSADGGWVAELAAKRDANEAMLRPAMESDAMPIDPHRLLGELRDVLPRDASVAVDGETIMGITRQILPSYGARQLQRGHHGLHGNGCPLRDRRGSPGPRRPPSRSSATTRSAPRRIACRDRRARGCQRSCSWWRTTRASPATRSRTGCSRPGSPRIASLLPAHYEKMAEMVDGHAERVDEAPEIRPALERALAADRPALVHVRSTPRRHVSGGVYLR